MIHKRKEALKDFLDLKKRGVLRLDFDNIITIENTLKQPDYKAMCEKMSNKFKDFKDVYEDDIAGRLPAPSSDKMLEEVNEVLTEYKAMKGEDR